MFCDNLKCPCATRFVDSMLTIFRYLPFGINGVLAGSATVFFSYIGFDAVASAAEEVCSITFLRNMMFEL